MTDMTDMTDITDITDLCFVRKAPGTRFEYLSCHLQFAGAMAVAASGKPIQALFYEYLYKVAVRIRIVFIFMNLLTKLALQYLTAFQHDPNGLVPREKSPHGCWNCFHWE